MAYDSPEGSVNGADTQKTSFIDDNPFTNPPKSFSSESIDLFRPQTDNSVERMGFPDLEKTLAFAGSSEPEIIKGTRVEEVGKVPFEHFNTSERFSDQIKEQYEELPQYLRTMADQIGLKVYGGPRVDIANDIYGRKSSIRNLERFSGLAWGGTNMNMILVGEKSLKEGGERVNHDPQGTFRHEFGHIVDYNADDTIKYSNSQEYESAFLKDLTHMERSGSKMSEFQRNYVTQAGRAGQAESFAEIAGELIIGEDPDKNPVLTSFPNCTKLVQKKLSEIERKYGKSDHGPGRISSNQSDRTPYKVPGTADRVNEMTITSKPIDGAKDMIKGLGADDETVEKVKEAFDKLPEKLQEVLKQKGLKVYVADKLSTAVPQLKIDSPYSQFQDAEKYDTSASLYSSSSSGVRVALGESYMYGGSLTRNSNIGGTFLSQLATVFDEPMGGLSKSDQFKAAYQKDLANIKANGTDIPDYLYSRLLSGNDTSVKRAFGDVFGSIHGAHPYSSEILASFPSVKSLMESRLNKIR